MGADGGSLSSRERRAEKGTNVGCGAERFFQMYYRVEGREF